MPYDLHLLLQIDRPVRIVEECLPTRVLRVAEFDRQERTALRTNRLLDEPDACFLGRAATFAHVASHTRAHKVLPRRFTATAGGHHVVEAKLARRKTLAAVLAEIFISSEDVAAIQSHALFRHAIVVEQPQHARHLDLKVHTANPISMGPLELGLHFTDFSPSIEVVIGPLVSIDMDDLSQSTEKKTNRASHIDDMNRNVLTIKKQNAGAQSCTISGRHTWVTPALVFSRVLGSHWCMAIVAPRPTMTILVASQP
jgi:hypothetical protein